VPVTPPYAALRPIQEPVPNEVSPRPLCLVVDAQRTTLGPVGSLVGADGERFDDEVHGFAGLRSSAQVWSAPMTGQKERMNFGPVDTA